MSAPRRLRRASAAAAAHRRLATVVLAAAAFATVSGCRRSPEAPARDAVQEAFREEGLTAEQAHGHRLFVQHCATCHGAQGRGDGQNAYNLDPPPPDFESSLARLPADQRRRVVLAGTAAIGRSPLCPPRGGLLGPEEADAVMAWLEVASRPAPERASTSPGSPRGRRQPRP